MPRMVLAMVMVAACHPARPAPNVATAALGDLPDDEHSLEAVRAATERSCPAATPWLWRVERDGRTGYILGTQHVGVGLAKLPPVVGELVDRARVLAVEIIEDTPEPDGGQPLSRALGEPAWSRLLALVGAEHAPVLDAASAGAVLSLLVAMYLDREASLDEDLIERANRQGISVVGLETARERAPVVARWLGADTLRSFLLASRGRRELRDKTQASLADFCGRRDADETRDRGAAAAMHHDLITARTRAWLPRVDALFASGGVFIAVGQKHLVGDGGLLALLARRGYRVTAVTR